MGWDQIHGPFLTGTIDKRLIHFPAALKNHMLSPMSLKQLCDMTLKFSNTLETQHITAEADTEVQMVQMGS